MRSFVVFSLFVLIFSGAAAAQSGRRITAQPTPDAVLQKKAEE